MVRRSGAALTLPRRERLRRAADIQALFQRGKREESTSFVALWRVDQPGRAAGFAVSRQLRGAVDRNRARRRLREAYRHHQAALPHGVQVVFIARPAALTRPFRDLLGEMERTVEALARAGRSSS